MMRRARPRAARDTLTSRQISSPTKTNSTRGPGPLIRSRVAATNGWGLRSVSGTAVRGVGLAGFGATRGTPARRPQISSMTITGSTPSRSLGKGGRADAVPAFSLAQ